MAMNIWKTLGIEPTKDVIAIKRAYTSLAHKINPEDEPDKFRELHDAYRMALNYAKSNGITVNFTARQPSVVKTAPKEDNNNSGFEFSPVSESNADKSSHANNETVDEKQEDLFDFSSLNTEQIDNSGVNNIIDDIVNFRERNKLTKYSEVAGIPLRLKVNLSQTLFGKYQSLVRISNDINIWNSYLDEPLIRNCITYSNFREWLLSVLDEETIKQLNLRETLDKLGKEEKRSDIHEIDTEAVKKEHKKRVFKGLFLPLGICFFLALVIVGVNVILHKEVSDLSAIALFGLVLFSVAIVLWFIICEHLREN